ncbi:hypothetical protein BV20DRAFT_967383 [Pilatotrama ljubarskyi]|nr:hypothetical protein BV20DRAFT_967383 [Pilatotrama ljubarskyi]
MKAFAMAFVHASVPTFGFPCLRHIYLGEVIASDVTKRRTRSLLTDFLSNCPLLEHVHLKGLPRVGTTTVASQPVRLNRLRSLTCVHGDMKTAMDLVASIDFPTTTLVRLDNARCDLPSDIRFNAPLASPAFLQTLTRLHVSDTFNDLHLIAEGASSGIYIHAVYDNSAGQGWNDWLGDMLAIHSFPAVTELQVSLAGGSEFVTATALRKMPLLTKIRILPDRAWGMQVSEGLLSRLYRSLGSEPVCCPRLETLHISISREDLPEHLQPEDLNPTIVARAREGHPIRRLELSAYDGTRGYAPRWDSYLKVLEPARQCGLSVHTSDEGSFPAGACTDQRRTDIWRTDGAEEFWVLSEDERARYTFR